MGVVSYIIGFAVLAVIVYYVAVGIFLLFKEFIPFLWDAFRYERKGICPQCHQKYSRQQVRLANDQTYGGPVIWQNVCPNGHVGMKHGDRRFADWADH